MQIYWSLSQIPELVGLSRRQRRKVFESCRSRYMLRARVTRWSLIAYLSFLCAPVASVALASVVLDVRSEWIWSLIVVAGTLIGLRSSTLISMSYLRPHYRDYIQTEVRETVA